MQQVEEAIAKHQNVRDRPQHGENKNRNERIHHIQQAIQHLKAAGLDDWAGELMKHTHGRHHGDREINELQNHVRELSCALHEIQRHLE